MTVQAFRFALDPTPRQVGALFRHAGAARVAFNRGPAQVRANLGQREAERSYGVADADLTPALGWSLYALRKEWNRAKQDVAPWWSGCSKEAYNTGLDQLARGLGNFADSKSGGRRGPRMGFPVFKSRRRAVPSVRFTTGTIRAQADRRHVTLPVVEDLNVAGMKRNRRLSQQVSDASFGEIRRQLSYKTEWGGGTLAVADRWYPSSKTCSRCKTVKPKLSLRERTFHCGVCGLVLDRDLNAALNLADLVDRHVAGSGPETISGRGADRKTGPGPAGGRETSTPHPVSAGTRRGPSPGNGRNPEQH